MIVHDKAEPTSLDVKTDTEVSTSSTATISGSHIPKDVKFRPEKRTVAHSHPYLRGNFYPVFEETIDEDGIECEVIGIIPESLRGSQYVRTGPNSLQIPDHHAAYHFFDGDGMLHGVYFPPGTPEEENSKAPVRARYMNRYVRSEVFEKTNKHGTVFPSVGLIANGGRSAFQAILEIVKITIKGAFFRLTNVSTGNTALAFVGNRFLALQEAGAPIEAKVPSLDTVGQFYFEEEGQSKGKVMMPNQEACTAHPKNDPKTGETVFFSWHILKPFVRYSVISADGKRKVWEEPIPGFDKPVMMHDFAITPTYSIIIKVGYVLDPVKNIRRGQPLMSFDESLPTRFGIVPRHFNHKRDKILWFEAPTCHIFHTANAWEEKDVDGNVIAVCMTACRSERFVASINQWAPTGPNDNGGGKAPEEYKEAYVHPGDGKYDQQDPDATFLTLFRFDLKAMQTHITTLTTISGEFPVFNFDWYMRPESRYTYIAVGPPPLPHTGQKIDGIMKLDTRAVIERQQELLKQGGLKNNGGHGQWEIGTQELLQVEKKHHRVHRFGGSFYGGEAFFVPNLPTHEGEELEEDDGHVLVYVYDESQMKEDIVIHPDRQVTELWIFDAKNIGQEHGPVAKVKIPRRVPYGFHGLHVTRKQIQTNQAFLLKRSRNA
ncbi:hypothetical protein EDD11_000808 [Mortierella claussenii]|nr:hypothetical protein EDD11_000808 [Mortierella claussenii]